MHPDDWELFSELVCIGAAPSQGRRLFEKPERDAAFQVSDLEQFLMPFGRLVRNFTKHRLLSGAYQYGKNKNSFGEVFACLSAVFLQVGRVVSANNGLNLIEHRIQVLHIRISDEKICDTTECTASNQASLMK
ncbi:hypothetical protein [uncultured Roseibium sp.]|uniref:hypothetical protein n=1 Tax=uncultured Roseibium sp. TaxID=1936171 RepID=UPI0026025276|nr:hypothetical protein [uncultured Roseibium sp.]